MKVWKRQNSFGAQYNFKIERHLRDMISGPCSLASNDYLLQESPHPGMQSFQFTLEHGYRFPLSVFAWLSSFSTSSVAISKKVGCWLADIHSVFLRPLLIRTLSACTEKYSLRNFYLAKFGAANGKHLMLLQLFLPENKTYVSFYRLCLQNAL